MSDMLKLRAQADVKWDCVSFGEVMLRFDPGFGRVRTARQFQVWEGGGEYNVARAMRKCWGKRASVVTALNTRGPEAGQFEFGADRDAEPVLYLPEYSKRGHLYAGGENERLGLCDIHLGECSLDSTSGDTADFIVIGH